MNEYNTADYVVAVWWYTKEGKIWDFRKSKQDGELYQNRYMIYSVKENHNSLWERIVNRYVSDPAGREELLEKGYDYYKRGYVVYNTMTAACEIWCYDSNLCSSFEFRKMITKHFNLDYTRTDLNCCS